MIKSKNILISVIVPVYNSQNTIKYSVRSIQNQNISQIEIILINDFSKDNSLKFIQNLRNEDPRINIINNKKNYGTLYSRSIGVLSSKGKYIFSLDNDDMYFNNDVLDIVFRTARIGNFDIVKFRKYNILKKNLNYNKIRNIYINQQKEIILHQPELGIYPISKNGKFKHNDYTIWDKCIKTNIYKKSINKLIPELYSKNISWNEDIIIVLIIFNNSQSFKIINKYGIIHIISNSSTGHILSFNKKLFCDIFFLYIIFKFTKNNLCKNYAAEYLINNKRFLHIHFNNKNRFYLKSIIKKIISV